MKQGETVELDIIDVAYGGGGVGRHDGLVCFVPQVLTGERVSATVTRKTARYASAVCRQIIRPSPDRCAPPCPYYARCGGCEYQHATYAAQLTVKHKQVSDTLQRIGGFREVAVDPLVPSPAPYGYRNKITLHGPGRPAFIGRDGSSRVPVEQCMIAADAINARLKDLAHGTDLKCGEDLRVRCNSRGDVECVSDSDRAGLQNRMLIESVGALEFHVPVGAFFQVNIPVLERILDALARKITERGCRYIADAYCGVGVFSLSLAGRVERCVGVESAADAVSAAGANAQRMGLSNCQFQAGLTEDYLSAVLADMPADSTCLILDPPRAGCERNVIQTILDRRPRQVLYISCVPPMLARDAKQLAAGGYRLGSVMPFDMFPQTAHCEVMAEFVLP